MRRFSVPVGLHLAVVVLLLFAALITACGNTSSLAPTKNYQQIVLFSDLHLPGKNTPSAEKAVTTVNGWADADMVVVLGDIVYDRGTPEEFAFAKQFFSKLTKPVYFINGNHDYIYEDDISPVTKKHVKASPQTRAAKLERFKEAFNQKELYYTKQVGPYFLVFLAADDLYSPFLTQLSEQQLLWLRNELASHKQMPTIIFFHGPLDGTFGGNNDNVGSNHFIAQPAAVIDQVIQDNKQIFMWVAGHIHDAPTNANFSSPLNLYKNQVTTIHNTDMKGSSYLSDKDRTTTRHDNIWTNSLFLYQNKVVVKTYDHKTGQWIHSLERTVMPPKL